MSKVATLVLFTFLNVLLSCGKEDTVPDVIPVVKEKLVVVLGSSTAYGTGANPIDSSWVNKLSQKFAADKKKISIINLAAGGYSTYEVLPQGLNPSNRPAADTARNIEKAIKLSPDYVIINLPSNDINNGYSDKETLDNYQLLASRLNLQKIPFLITSTQPRNLATMDARKRLQDFNPQLTALLPNNVINYYSLLTDPATLNIASAVSAGDGIHLNNSGHTIIYNAFLNDKRMMPALGY